MKNFLTIPVMALALGMLGCASNSQVHKLESTSETNTRLLRENEQRLKNLETSVSSLNSQVAQLNNRVYEVRNRNGKKTSMTVVPIVPPTQAPNVLPATAAAAPTAASATPAASAASPAAGSAPEARATHPNSRAEALLASARRAAAARNQAQGAPASATGATGTQSAAATAPIGRMIDPAAAPTPIPAPVAVPRATRAQTERARTEQSAGATGSVGHPETVAGPSGTLAAQSATAPAALPPVDLPAQAPATAGAQAAPAKTAGAATTGAAVPVPAIPASSLALPPEHPDLPPVRQPQPAASAAALQTATATATVPPAATPRTASPRGEEAAYKAALNATLAGRTTEGIRLFRDFLQHYPDGRYAANAEYWIGECLYSQGKYQDALAQFQGVNDGHPRHHKNADALLKAGMTLSRLGDKAGAAEKYRALMTQFPNSDAARRARAMGVVR